MARTRVTAPDEILSLRDAEEALAEIGRLQNELDAIDAKGSEQISKIKQKMAKDGDVQRARIQAFEANLALYAKYNKSELFKEKKNIEVSTGSFGFRLSTSVRTKKTTVELLKKLYPGRALRVKEEPDKDQLKDWTDEDLVSIDAAKTTKDEFGRMLLHKHRCSKTATPAMLQQYAKAGNG